MRVNRDGVSVMAYIMGQGKERSGESGVRGGESGHSGRYAPSCSTELLACGSCTLNCA